MSRRIQAPGIEINEIDRSGYDSVTDNSIVGTTSLLMGFSDNGPNYQVTGINSIKTFSSVYGKPRNEAERYFYNGANEILNRGGRVYCAKLPYFNNSYDKYTYTSYSVSSNNPITLSSTSEIANKLNHRGISLFDFTFRPKFDFDEYSNIMMDLVGEVNFNTEDNFTIITEDGTGKKVDYCTFFNRNNIKLSSICDMFDYLCEKSNVSYQSYSTIKEVFYLSGQDFYNAYSVFMLSDLYYNGVEHFSDNYLSSHQKHLSSEISSIMEQLMTIGDLNSVIDDFGNTKTIGYFRNYIKNLENEVLNITNPDEGEVIPQISAFIETYLSMDGIKAKYTSLKNTDSSLGTYLEIFSNQQDKDNCGMITTENLDDFRTGNKVVPKDNIYIVDISRGKYTNDYSKKKNKEYVGLVTAITTPIQAMKLQNLIDTEYEEESDYLTIKDMQNVFSNFIDSEGNKNVLSGLNNERNCISSNMIAGFTQNFGSESAVEKEEQTLSKTVDGYFPKFTFRDGNFDHEEIKNICIVIMKMYIDTANDGKISFLPVESFTGSLNKYATNDKGGTIFIDNIVNSNSKYINLFSNVKFSRNVTEKPFETDKASLFHIRNQTITSLGFYDSDTIKTIGLETSINKSIGRILESLNDPNRYQIDIVIDGGVSNIAQFIKSVYPNEKIGYYEPNGDKQYLFNMDSANCLSQWRTTIGKYDDFCKNTRKDCMFIADGPRPLAIEGNEKIVRNTKNSNTIKKNILPKIKNMSGFINSSYGAGYCDWFYIQDASSGDYFWCPPSIKAAGIYTYTDAYSNYWMAPAGLNRGRLPEDVIDVAFSPTIEEAGIIYNNNWNYSINYPIDGIVMEGQRTFQKNKTALDRVNVRRLMLGLEKNVKYIAKFFNYEGITDYLMTRFRDQVSYILENVRNKGGISEYVVICDARNNTIQTIENNELHCTIAVKPIKALEFICLNFVCTNQSANVQEVAESEM